MSNSVLVSYTGYPLVVSGLMPDDGLATLAGCLIENGHQTRILDYTTVDLFERFPHEHAAQLHELSETIKSRLDSGEEVGTDLLAEYKGIEAKVDAFQEQIDEDIAAEVLQEVDRTKADFVGLKLWMGDGFTGSTRIAEFIRRNRPDLLIVGGGPQVDWYKDLIFRVTDAFDILVQGEGDETIVMLADYFAKNGRIRSIDDIPNLILPSNGKSRQPKFTEFRRVANMDSLPFPVYDPEIYPAMAGDRKLKMILIDESRGCPNSCNFCIHPKKSGRKRRSKSAARIADEMQHNIENYNTRVFRLAGSNTPVKLHNELAAEILARGIDVTYSGFGHVRELPKAQLEDMKKAGCYALFFGMESGSEYILRESIDKRCTPEHIRDAIVRTKQAGIKAVTSIIYPAPLETEETTQETLDLLYQIRPDSILVCLPGVVLGNEWEQNPERYQIKFDSPESAGIEFMTYKARLAAPPSFMESHAIYHQWQIIS